MGTSSKPDTSRVSELKEKARREQDASTPNSGNTVHSVLYGAHLDNQRADGGGEYEQ